VPISLQDLEEHENITPENEHNNFAITDPKEIVFYKFLDKEFKVIVLRKLHKL
jgi:hypothetical protein